MLVVLANVYANGKSVSNLTIPLGGGMVSLIGNGGISAGNSLTVNATVWVNATTWGKEPKSVTIRLDGAFFIPAKIDSHGVAGYAALSLEKVGDLWGRLCTKTCQVQYDQGGSLPISVSVDDTFVMVIGQVQMGSQDVTIGSRTNSLILSLTWAILAFAVLELRVDCERRYP